MSNPEAVKMANTELARALRIIARGENFELAYPEENFAINQSPESVVPRLFVEALAVMVAKIDNLESYAEELELALEECERGTCGATCDCPSS